MEVVSPGEKSKPSITIVVAAFNAAKTIQICIDSVAGQAYTNRELVVIDGGSTDGTVEILAANAEKISYWESERDRGIFHAWNKALEHAGGDWIYFLGADDYFWSPDALRGMVPYLEEASALGMRVAYGRVAFVSADGTVLDVWGWPWRRAKFHQDMAIPHQGVLHHRSLFGLHGRFDESLVTAGDYELLLRELKSRDALFAPDVILTGMRAGGISNKPSNQLLNIRETAGVRRRHGLTGFSAPLLRRRLYAFRALARLWVSGLVGTGRIDRLVALYRSMRGRKAEWPDRRFDG